MKTKLLLCILALMLIIAPIRLRAATFPDVPDDHYYNEAVELLYKMKVVKGYSDGSFKPENPVTRVEALKIVMEGARLAVPEATAGANAGFSDIDQQAWYLRYLLKARELGLIKGNPDGTFAPVRQVNKVELIKMLVLANQIDLTRETVGVDLPYSDVNQSEWYVPYLKYAVKYYLVAGNPAEKIEPGKTLSRGEVAEIVYRLLLITQGGEIQKYLSQSEAALELAFSYLERNNWEKAKLYADQAAGYSEQALTISPDKAIAKAANKITNALLKLLAAIFAKEKNEQANANVLALEAKILAQEGALLTARVKPLTDKIVSLADQLIVE